MIELPTRAGKDDAASLLESADAAASDEPRAPSPWARLASRLATPLLPDAGGPRGRLAKFLGLSYALLLGAFYFVRAHGDPGAVTVYRVGVPPTTKTLPSTDYKSAGRPEIVVEIRGPTTSRL